MRNTDTVSAAWCPGEHPPETSVFLLLRWLQAGLLTVMLVQKPEERDFWSGLELDLLLLLLAPSKKNMLLWPGTDKDQQCPGGNQSMHYASHYAYLQIQWEEACPLCNVSKSHWSEFALHPLPFPTLQCWLIKCGDSSLSEGMLVYTMSVLIPQCYFL